MNDSAADWTIDDERIVRESFVARVELHEEVASTNNVAIARAAENDTACPLLIVARRQTAGRGRGQNAWWSSGGALTFSLLLDAERMELAKTAWPQASLATGLAVYEAVRGLLPGEPLGLKWPNDVYLRGRKLCGVLVEAARAPQARSERLVVGIGINVNNAFEGAPDDVRRRAVALREAAGAEFDLTDVLARLVASLERCYQDVATEPQSLAERWREACLLRGRRVRLSVGSRVVEGVCRGIDRDGALVVQSGDDEQRFFGGVVESFS